MTLFLKFLQHRVRIGAKFYSKLIGSEIILNKTICPVCSSTFILSKRHFYPGIQGDPTIRKVNHGSFDWIFPFPTFDSSEALEENMKLRNPIVNYFNENIDSNMLDQNAYIENDILQKLKEMELFGLQIPDTYGGLGLSNIQYARMMEDLSRDLSISLTLNVHNSIVSKAILLYGTEELKQKYLPKLASGEMIGAYCLTEPTCGSDVAGLISEANLSDAGDHWILNGHKTWVTNGGIADLYLVFARVIEVETDGSEKKRITAFLIESNSEGITHGPSVNRIGLRAANICNVSFNNTKVPAKNFIGERGHGFKIAMSLLNQDRFTMAATGAGYLKRLVATTAEHVSKREQFGKPLSEQVLVQEKFFQMEKQIYVMESMAYFIAGHMDMEEEAGEPYDLAVESAIAKIYSADVICKVVDECSVLAGGIGLLNGFEYERCLRDARMLQMYQGANDLLRTYVGLSGIEHLSKKQKHSLRMFKEKRVRVITTAVVDLFRDAFSHPDKVGRINKKIPSFGVTARHEHSLWLDENLENLGKQLEHSVSLFDKKMYYLCTKYGNDIANEHQLIHRITEAITNLFATSVVLARVNKALVLGLREREHEFGLASSFIMETLLTNSRIYWDLRMPEYRTMDCVNKRLGKEVLGERRVQVPHPLDTLPRFEQIPYYEKELKRIQEK